MFQEKGPVVDVIVEQAQKEEQPPLTTAVVDPIVPSAMPFTVVAYHEDGSVKGITVERGMTLRDYFAGQCAAGVMGVVMNAIANAPETVTEDLVQHSAIACYQFADAMMKAREVKPS